MAFLIWREARRRQEGILVCTKKRGKRTVMDYRRLGNTGLMVSELCLGCMTFGREADEQLSHRIIGRFIEVGGNFIDTADVYSRGMSEEITGRTLQGIRDDIVLATKVRSAMGSKPNDVGASRKHIIQGCEASLKRLGTDYGERSRRYLSL